MARDAAEPLQDRREVEDDVGLLRVVRCRQEDLRSFVVWGVLLIMLIKCRGLLLGNLVTFN